MAERLDSLPARAAKQARAYLIDIFNHAVTKGLCVDNPAACTIARIEKKRKRHTVNAIDLALITAQRRADILSMKFEDVRDGHLYVIQQKTATLRPSTRSTSAVNLELPSA
ncbi:hypothetical protein SAMN05216600_1292 [Pseudomonas cuatrocienegasensis]|uniref:Phage integrase family protein n=1 Tax=Pseudomonas cuatrocienegasensis TaxID=543360 RepID=A0ABY1BR57_9PSED|nr:hypothetical protein A7D25_21510 [Pseudomonas sp. 21C1]SER42550.1 hypothetical protein SAMN05216600_1292 [Pseudomonas cuatrocienegasensis]